MGAPGFDGYDGEQGDPGQQGPPGPPGRIGGNYAQLTPADASVSHNTGILMAGFSAGIPTIAPQASGVFLVTITGIWRTDATGGSRVLQLRYGTGNGPANGAANQGTLIGAELRSSFIHSIGEGDWFSMAGLILSATIGDSLWVDLAFGATGAGGGTMSVEDVTISVVEHAGLGIATYPYGVPGNDGEDGADGAPGPQGPVGPAGAVGAAVMTAFTKDLGAARRSGTFDITGLAGLTADKVVTIVQTAAQVASKGNARDEPQMDQIQLTGYVVDAATIRAHWWAPAVVVGTYAFAYAVNG
jgi:hypothetical protein